MAAVQGLLLLNQIVCVPCWPPSGFGATTTTRSTLLHVFLTVMSAAPKQREDNAQKQITDLIRGDLLQPELTFVV